MEKVALKTCFKCKMLKKLDDFNKRASNRDGHTGTCKACKNAYLLLYYAGHPRVYGTKMQAYKRAYYLKHKNRIMAQRLAFKHSMTAEDFSYLLGEQDNKCAICLKDMPYPCVDHDHECCPGERSCGKCVRGLLFSNCNTAIGMLKDDTSNLQRAIKYLNKEKH